MDSNPVTRNETSTKEDSMHVTTLEIAILDCIARNQFSPVNGAWPKSAEETGTWSADILDSAVVERPGIRQRSVPGILASLIKKGLAWSNGESTALTATGYAVWADKFASEKK
jgi:hypothetical protein